MEDKRLDFNAPLLSVRRHSLDGQNSKKNENGTGNKTRVLPFYKPDLKSGPMRHAGTVPFVWEQIPGKRKDGQVSPDRSMERPPVAPRLPPGRSVRVKKKMQSLEEEFEEPPRNDKGLGTRHKVLPMNGNVPEVERLKEGKKEKGDSDNEDGDEVYADALDTLSRSESSLFNCSVSGISRLDGTNIKRSGDFSSNLQARDFMMDRFLPAAKAMASETPQHASWKQPVMREQQMVAKKIGDGDKLPPLYQYKPYTEQYVEGIVQEEDSDDDDDYDYGDNSSSSAKACGFFPKFCLKNSLCLLNPVPGMKVRSRGSFPSVRTFNPHVKSTYSGAHSGTDDENNWEGVYKHKLLRGLQPLDDGSKRTSESNQLTHWSDSQTPDGSSSHMQSDGGGISPFRNEFMHSTFQEGVGFLGIPKQVKNTKMNNSALYKDSKWDPHSLSPMVEKTLHVDSGNLQPWISNISFSDSTGMIVCKDNDNEILTKSQGIDDCPVAVCVPGDIDNLPISQERGTSEVSTSYKSNSERYIDTTECFRKCGILDQESRSLMLSKVDTCGNLESEETFSLKKEEERKNIDDHLQLPLPPPLPKSPTESWLWRTLPSISSKNGASYHPGKQFSKTPSTDPKWETIVKTSNVFPGHLRFSKELATTVSQNSET